MAGKLQFDRDEVLKIATKVFWRKGFRHTTMRDIVAETGVRESSLYNTFGDKLGLYREVLKEYDRRFVANLESCTDPESPLRTIKNFWNRMGDVALHPRGGPGCLYLNVAVELSHENPEHGRAAKEAYQRIEQKFNALLIEAREAGEIGPDHDTQKLARFLTHSMQGLMASMATRPGEPFIRDSIDVVLGVLNS